MTRTLAMCPLLSLPPCYEPIIERISFLELPYKLPRTEGLKTEIFSCTVLEARSLTSKGQQRHTPSAAPSGGPPLPCLFQLPEVVAGLDLLCLVAASLESLPLTSRGHPLWVSVSQFLSNDTSHWTRTHIDPIRPHFNFTNLPRPYDQGHILRF